MSLKRMTPPNPAEPRPAISLEPMKVSGIQHLVERAYRESAPFQYIRELFKNAVEAGATRIEFSPEWQGVQRGGVYRLMVADDGRGMDPEQILAFLNTFGGGGKPIGDAHENFGIGSKTSTLPWNHHGVVVLSRTAANPTGCMVWLQREPTTGQYGARRFETTDGSYETVIEPFDDADAGVDWRVVWPDWTKDHGTVVVLLGLTGREDTFLGKGEAGEEDAIKFVASSLNRRFWAIPEGMKVVVRELRSSKRSDWPRSFAQASGPQPKSGPDRRWNSRNIEGARYYVEHPGSKSGKPQAKGTVRLSGGTEIDWYLWEGIRPSVHTYALEQGYIAALYDNELYDVRSHVGSYRRFGVASKEVRERLTLIARPPKLADGEGVYPDHARSTLRIMGSKRAGEPLPWDEWAEEFVAQMPQPIRAAIVAATADNVGSIDDERWRDRLSDRFGDRWKRPGFQTTRAGAGTVTPTHSGGAGPGGSGGTGGSSGGGASGRGGSSRARPKGAGTQSGSAPAKAGAVQGALPSFRWTNMSEFENGAGAVWMPNAPGLPNGCVLLNREFRPLAEVFEHWRARYAEHHWPIVNTVIEAVYGEAMVARIAHSEALVKNADWGRERVQNELRSPESLTMAALGLVNEDTVIAQRIGARIGASRSRAPELGPATAS